MVDISGAGMVPYDKASDPWRPIAEVDLESGRIVEVRRMLVTMTFGDFMLASRETGSGSIRTRPGRRFVYKNEFRPCEDIVIVDEGKGEDPLPNYRIVAYMESKAPVNSQNPEIICSYLTTCWFVDDVTILLEELVRGLFRKIKWEDHARDRHVDDL
ncbi:MAG: hypothetical protein ACE5JQ_14765 [Candidatus Methylomirabilales bacterium]